MKFQHKKYLIQKIFVWIFLTINLAIYFVTVCIQSSFEIIAIALITIIASTVLIAASNLMITDLTKASVIIAYVSVAVLSVVLLIKLFIDFGLNSAIYLALAMVIETIATWLITYRYRILKTVKKIFNRKQK